MKHPRNAFVMTVVLTDSVRTVVLTSPPEGATTRFHCCPQPRRLDEGTPTVMTVVLTDSVMTVVLTSPREGLRRGSSLADQSSTGTTWMMFTLPFWPHCEVKAPAARGQGAGLIDRQVDVAFAVDDEVGRWAGSRSLYNFVGAAGAIREHVDALTAVSKLGHVEARVIARADLDGVIRAAKQHRHRQRPPHCSILALGRTLAKQVLNAPGRDPGYLGSLGRWLIDRVAGRR